MVAVLGGHAGAWYREALAGRSIDLHEVSVEGETRTCLSVLDEATGALTEFYEAGVRLDAADWARVEAALRAAIGGDGAGTVVALAGQPPARDPGGRLRPARPARDGGRRARRRRQRRAVAGRRARRATVAVKVNAAEAETVTGAERADGEPRRHGRRGAA